MSNDSSSSSHGHPVVVALLIAVVVPLLLVIVVPNLLITRRTPGEASSVGSVRTINTAAVTYASTYPKIGFPPSLAVLDGRDADCNPPSEQHACLIDSVLASGLKSGYRYRYAPVTKDGVAVAYTVHADPVPHELTWWERVLRTEPPSDRHFFSDESAVIRSEKGREAGPQSPPL